MNRFTIPTLLIAATLALAAEPEGYVGITIGKDLSTVTAVHPDSPADRAGISVGDRIVAIDGRSTQGMAAEEFARLVRAGVGAAIQIDVQRPDTNGVLRLRLYRLATPTPTPSISPDISSRQASARSERPNQAMQRTAGRAAFELSMTSTFSLQLRSPSPAVADLVSR